MFDRLERFFPSAGPGFSTFWSDPMSILFKSLMSATSSDYDTLVFFDYMCLPQIGKTEDGTIIERTLAEQECFRRTLPAVGLLYTMFPVMVCPEVADWNEPYFTSGWCFSEWEQSELCGTLSTYSSSINDEQRRGRSAVSAKGSTASQATMQQDDKASCRTKKILDCFENDLKNKKFRVEGD